MILSPAKILILTYNASCINKRLKSLFSVKTSFKFHTFNIAKIFSNRVLKFINNLIYRIVF